MFRARTGPMHKARDSNLPTDPLLGGTSASTSGISLHSSLTNGGPTTSFRESSPSSGGEIYYLPIRIPAFVVKLYRAAASHSQTWKQALPQISVLASAAFLIYTLVWAIHYIKVSRIYVPAYHTVPLVTDAQIQAASSRHMTHDQCMASFPGLYDEADRVVDYWITRGGVSKRQMERAADRPQTARVLIKDGEMYVKRFEPERHSRTRASLALIHEAILTSVEPIPDIEFVIQTDDMGDATDELPLMVLDRLEKQNHLWLMPDFGFGSWPEPKVGYYPEVVRKAQDFDRKMSWEEKVPQLFWKGALLIPLRRKLFDLARQYSWGKIEEVDWRNKDTVITMDEHCGFKYLAHLEGYAYSGRLKYILQCKSVVVAHEMDYVQHFHHLINSTMFSPHQNMVVVDKDWKDLPRVMELLEERDSYAKELAEQSQKFWSHYISKQSIDCYWRYLFRRWAEVQRYTPELHYEDTPFASFILLGKTHWDPY